MIFVVVVVQSSRGAHGGFQGEKVEEHDRPMTEHDDRQPELEFGSECGKAENSAADGKETPEEHRRPAGVARLHVRPVDVGVSKRPVVAGVRPGDR